MNLNESGSGSGECSNDGAASDGLVPVETGEFTRRCLFLKNLPEQLAQPGVDIAPPGGHEVPQAPVPQRTKTILAREAEAYGNDCAVGLQDQGRNQVGEGAVEFAGIKLLRENRAWIFTQQLAMSQI